MNTKEDIIRGFLKDLEEYNRVLKKIEKSEALFNAITENSKMPLNEFNKLYVDFKINHAELLLEELQNFVNALEKKYAWLSDYLVFINKNKRELRDIKYSKDTNLDKTIKNCDKIIKEVYLKYNELQDNEKKLIRNGLVKFTIFYGTICTILSIGVSFFIFDQIKEDVVKAGLWWVLFVIITWNVAKDKYWI